MSAPPYSDIFLWCLGCPLCLCRSCSGAQPQPLGGPHFSLTHPWGLAGQGNGIFTILFIDANNSGLVRVVPSSNPLLSSQALLEAGCDDQPVVLFLRDTQVAGGADHLWGRGGGRGGTWVPDESAGGPGGRRTRASRTSPASSSPARSLASSVGCPSPLPPSSPLGPPLQTHFRSRLSCSYTLPHSDSCRHKCVCVYCTSASIFIGSHIFHTHARRIFFLRAYSCILGPNLSSFHATD